MTDQASGSQTQFALLAKRKFLPLFITQFLGALNDNVFKNGLVILITYQLATARGYNAQVMVTLAAGLFILPFLLFSATAGQLADKYERSRLIAIVKFFEIVLMLIAAIGFYRHNTFLLMTVLFLVGTQATFFGPLKYAILPDHLAKNELVGGNGLIEAGTFLAILIGTILGGSFILTDAGIHIVSIMIIGFSVIGFISSCFIPLTHNRMPSLSINYNFVSETYRLLKYSKQHWDIFLAILGISWFWLIGAVYLAEFSAYAKDILHANNHVVTLFITLFSLGIALGSLFCNRLLRGKVHATYVPLGALGMTVFAIDLYFASGHVVYTAQSGLMGVGEFLLAITHWRILLDLLFIAISGGLYIVPLYAILQSRSHPEHRARIIASNNVMNALFMVIAAVGTMMMLALGLKITTVFLIVAMLTGAVALYICKLLPEALLKSWVKWLMQLLFRVEVRGLENYELAGDRFLIIANHTSFLDAGLLAAFMPDKLTFAVNTFTAKKWWIKLFLRMVDAFPLDPTNPMAIKSLIEYVSQDKKCVIFPEGRITVTGALMKIYEGPGLIADKAKAKLLPVHIEGAQFSHFSRLKNKLRLHWFPKVILTILPPQTFIAPVELKGRKRRHYISSQLYDLMTEMVFHGSDYQQTLFASLLKVRNFFGSQHIVAEDIAREPLTYQQLIMRSFILGDVIASNTKWGEYIGVLLPNAIANLVTFFAIHAYSRVPAMLNYSTGTKHVLTACVSAQLREVYTSRRFIEAARLEEMVEKIQASGIHVFYLEDLVKQISLWSKVKGWAKAQFPQWSYKKAGLDPNTPAVILFTSGSEGSPKGVVLSHSNIQANRFQLSARVDFTAADQVFNALPLFHSFGLTGGMLLPVLSGLKVFFYPSPLHYRIVPELAYDTNSTILFGTDTFLSGYAKYAHPFDFFSMRYVFAGAEKLKEETRKLWAEKFGLRVFEGYGATETSPVLATNTPMQNRVGTVGRFLPGIQYRLEAVPGITEGQRLSVAGPNIMLGYLRAENPGVIEKPVEGWYDTGDIISLDADGYVAIKGRAKRFAKIGGEMVSLIGVENYITQCWPAFAHAVVTVSDSKKGEQLILVTTNQDATRETLIAYAKSIGISEIQIPKKILIVNNLPLLGSGKTDYVSLQQMVQVGAEA